MTFIVLITICLNIADYGRLGILCVGFVCSTHACVGFLVGAPESLQRPTKSHGAIK